MSIIDYSVPDELPDNLKKGFETSQRLLEECFTSIQDSSKKNRPEINLRKGLAYSLKGVTIIGSILISINFIPHEIAIGLLFSYGADTWLSNSKRLVSLELSSKALTSLAKRVARRHAEEQSIIFNKEDPIEKFRLLTDLNNNLIKIANMELEKIEEAIDQSDLQILQALSLDEETFNLARKRLNN